MAGETDRLSNLERRVDVLEAVYKKDISHIESILNEKFMHIEQIIGDLKGDIDELKSDVQELKETWAKNKAKYNGYHDKFVEKNDFDELKTEVEKIKAYDSGVMSWLNKWGAVFAILASITAVLLALGVL